jgi:hypothetical protein
MGASIKIPIIVVCHMTKTTQTLSLVVWSNMGPPNFIWVVLLNDLTTWFLVMIICIRATTKTLLSKWWLNMKFQVLFQWNAYNQGIDHR